MLNYNSSNLRSIQNVWAFSISKYTFNLIGSNKGILFRLQLHAQIVVTYGLIVVFESVLHHNNFFHVLSSSTPKQGLDLDDSLVVFPAKKFYAVLFRIAVCHVALVVLDLILMHLIRSSKSIAKIFLSVSSECFEVEVGRLIFNRKCVIVG